MRVVCAVLASILMSGVAFAHPVRDPFDEPFDRDDLIRRKGSKRKLQPVRTPEELCERNKSWPKLVKCLAQGGNTVATMRDLGKGRLVSVKSNPSYDSTSVFIYTKQDGRWQRMSGYFATNATSEILSFERLKKENGYRLEQGQIFKSTAFSTERFPGADQTRTPVTMRRKTTSICLDNGYCQTFITSCDALVDGKTRWSFRGTLLIDHGVVRMTGDRAYAGQVCAPAMSQLSNVGDILE
ncbi:MAG TPA: hypothetical protein VMZ53_30390 [Kofleriaceae bacterium]|nr:hypothetical protein [Kofleriaceae bacterium]